MRVPANTDFSRVTNIELPEEYAGQRIDNFLLALLKGVPRSRIYRIIRKGEVRVNRGRVQARYKLRAGDVLRLPPISVADKTAAPPMRPGKGLSSRLASAVLYEDDSVLVIDKPAGLAVHGGSGVQLGLIEALRELRADSNLELVHRLDRDTSGCIILARKRSALRQLHADMRSGEIGKYYQALAVGRWPQHLRQVRAPLMKNHLSSGERMVVVSKDGKSAETRFSVLRRFAQVATLVEASPITGRTHQIRVHARTVGHPLVGDEKYGDQSVHGQFRHLGSRRLFLHASKIRFRSPERSQVVEVAAVLPPELERVLVKLSEEGV